MSEQEYKREIERLRAENAKLQEQATNSRISLRVSESGYVDVYGIPGKGRYAMSCTPDGWTKLFGLQKQVQDFIAANGEKLAKAQAEYQAKRAVG